MLRELHSPCTPSNSDTSSASSLFSSSGDERSIISGRSGALQEIFSNIRLEQPSAERFCVDWESLFDLPDSPDCIAIDENGRIIAATVTKLVERLTSMVGIPVLPHKCINLSS